MLDISTYYEAESLDDAKRILTSSPNSKIIAGGTDLIIQIRDGALVNVSLIGIGRINELKEVNLCENGDIRIGPMVTFHELEQDCIIKERLPYLGEAGATMGGPQIRNVATIGGNLCNGAVSADSAAMLYCLNAVLILESVKTTRSMPIQDFYLGPGQVDLKTDEILTGIIIREKDYLGYQGRYIKASQRKVMDIAILGCAVSVFCKDGTIRDLRIACTVAAPTPVRCSSAEKMAVGLKVISDNIMKIRDAALTDVTPRDSWRGSKVYRKQLVKVNIQRALESLVLMNGGEIDANED